jgi:hypothetical protein
LVTPQLSAGPLGSRTNMFKEIYYWLYYYQKKFKTDTVPEFTALLILSFLQGMNILSVLVLFKYLFKIDIIGSLPSTQLGIFTAIFFFVWNYFTLFKKRIEICDKYDHLSSKQFEDGKVKLLFYVVFSIGICLLLGSFAEPKY